jgi:hypothetical protein
MMRALAETIIPAIDATNRALVLTHGEAQIGRERAFVATAGFDVSPDNLPSIDEALSSAVEPSGATSR